MTNLEIYMASSLHDLAELCGDKEAVKKFMAMEGKGVVIDWSVK